MCSGLGIRVEFRVWGSRSKGYGDSSIPHPPDIKITKSEYIIVLCYNAKLHLGVLVVINGVSRDIGLGALYIVGFLPSLEP